MINYISRNITYVSKQEGFYIVVNLAGNMILPQKEMDKIAPPKSKANYNKHNLSSTSVEHENGIVAGPSQKNALIFDNLTRA